MPRRSKAEQYDRFYSGKRVEIVNGDVVAFECEPGKKQSFLWDSVIRGLAISATPTGRKTFT